VSTGNTSQYIYIHTPEKLGFFFATPQQHSPDRQIILSLGGIFIVQIHATSYSSIRNYMSAET
jgi:hypothetical protein